MATVFVLRRQVEGRLQLEDKAAIAINKIRVGDRDSVQDFVQNHGSHYIRSISVGDAVYQVIYQDFYVEFGELTKPQTELNIGDNYWQQQQLTSIT